jgi:DNA-directed RNA polymerase subunit omega
MAQHVSTLMNPPVEDLLDKVDSKFTLVALASRRARQVNSYYNSLGEGIGVVVPPQVASLSGKPLSIAFEEVAAGKATFSRPDPEEEAALAEAAALAALEGSGEADGQGADGVGAGAEGAADGGVEGAADGGAEVAGSGSDSDSGSGDAPAE